ARVKHRAPREETIAKPHGLRGAIQLKVHNQLAAALSGSQLGELTESLINAQFSQSQESDADDFSYELLKKRGVNTQGLVTAFEKLAKLGGGDSSMFDSHPGSQARADHIRQRIAADRK
ncbi:M48 family metalloprotease, partial [Pseudomonas aeruginosa]|uniref:M48 family metalloprotease n=1 Tax=Pseudomonas aeruginosa TaxID=287 RepID=UPI0021565B5E